MLIHKLPYNYQYLMNRNDTTISTRSKIRNHLYCKINLELIKQNILKSYFHYFKEKSAHSNQSLVIEKNETG